MTIICHNTYISFPFDFGHWLFQEKNGYGGDLYMIEYQAHNSLSGNYHDIRLHILRNATYPAHLHKALEFVYVLEGELDFTVDNTPSHLTKGGMVLALSNQIHTFRANEYAKCYIHVFSSDLVEHFYKILGRKIGSSAEFTVNRTTRNYLLNNFILPISQKVKPIDQASEDIPGVGWYRNDSHMAMTHSIPPDVASDISMLPFLYAICDGYLSSVKLVEAKQKTDNVVHRLLIYVSEHFTEDITLSSVANTLGYEPHYVSRCFNSFIGIGFKQFLNNYRVDYAKSLLMDKNISITNAAYTSGFQSIRSFNRIFQETVGMSPTEFRKTTRL